jgi:hypothetical protein
MATMQIGVSPGSVDPRSAPLVDGAPSCAGPADTRT